MLLNLIEDMNKCLPDSSYEKPLLEINGWKFFLDENGFLPSASNTMLVAKILAWKDTEDNHYASCVGNSTPLGTIQYQKGRDLSTGFTQGCVIDTRFFSRYGSKGIQDECSKTLQRLIDFVSSRESLT